MGAEHSPRTAFHEMFSAPVIREAVMQQGPPCGAHCCCVLYFMMPVFVKERALLVESPTGF